MRRQSECQYADGAARANVSEQLESPTMNRLAAINYLQTIRTINGLFLD